jgi:glycosyltransferase involved in cell wall biosynthesis
VVAGIESTARWSDQVVRRPAICLNMIVRNEAHIVAEVLDSVAPYISSWVVVDTGSQDGTQELIRDHMSRLGIPGELHDRPWRNFGHNRTEALTLAQGHGDYIWVIDADDTVVGTPDFTGLNADIYCLQIKRASDDLWRPQVFRDGINVRYDGVVHEYAVWDDPCELVRLEGPYHIDSRSLGDRERCGHKLDSDRDLLLAEVDRNPEDPRSVFYLAQTYFDLGDFLNARTWYARRVEMGGWDEEVYCSLLRIAASMAELGEHWPDTQHAYLKAWEYRPTRAEALHAIAVQYREDQRYWLGYKFAKHANEIPVPEHDVLFVRADIHTWRAADEQAVCATWIDKHPEAFTLCRNLLARPDIPEDERQRITGNRDVCVPTMLDAARTYPDTTVLQSRQHPSPPDTHEGAEVVVSLVAGPDLTSTEHTLNSFLHCCTDLSLVGRFLIVDAGLSAPDRQTLHQRYEFLEFAHPSPAHRHNTQLGQIRAQITERFWLHLDPRWRFFAPENYITRLTAILDAEPQIFQVGINYTDAATLTGATAAEQALRQAPGTGRYTLTDNAARGPAMFDTARLDHAGGIDDTAEDPLTELTQRAATTGLHTATLDEILCITEIN